MPDITATRPASGAPVESAWGTQVHDLVEGVQCGQYTQNITAGVNSWRTTVTFTRPYLTPPVVVASTSSNSAIFWASTGNVTTTTVDVNVNRKDETNQGAVTTHQVSWIAVGQVVP